MTGPEFSWTKRMVRGPNGRRHRYVPRKPRWRRGMQRGAKLPLLRCLSRLCGSENTSPGSVLVDQTRPSRKAVTFSLEWTEESEAALCRRCRRHMQQHYHGELCRRCGAQFTINRTGSWRFLDFQDGVAHGASSPVLKKCLKRSESA